MGRGKIILLLSLMCAVMLPQTGHADAIVVSHDATDDWGMNASGDNSISPVGDALGQELAGAAIENDAEGHVNFIIQLKSLPPTGGVPEGSRYFWDFNVNGTLRELDGKFTNYSRGLCDPTAGHCPPARDPSELGTAPFFLRGNCQTVGTVVTCEELGIVHATFDTATSSIVIPVTLAQLGATGCSEVTAADDGFDGMLTAGPSAFLTSGYGPYDSLTFDDEIESVNVC